MHCGKDIVDTPDIEKTFLLSGKGSLRQVLGGGRRADRNRGTFAQLCVVIANLPLQRSRQGGLGDPAPDSPARLGQLTNVIDIQLRQLPVDPPGEIIVIQKFPVRIGGGSEAFGYRDPGMVEPTDHFSERRILPAHGRDIIDAELGERYDVGARHDDLTIPADMLYIGHPPDDGKCGEQKMSLDKRSVFVVSDRTGLTAEELARSLLTQFPQVHFVTTVLPFVDSDDKLNDALRQINQSSETSGSRPIVFVTFVNADYRKQIDAVNALVVDVFSSFIGMLSRELNVVPSWQPGYSHGVTDPLRYNSRIDAVHFAMDCDDGVNFDAYDQANMILIGVSRTGKTPTCIYLAMHFGLYCANYPLTDDDFFDDALPQVLRPYHDRLFGLTIDPQRLHEIREKRRPGSAYAKLSQCQLEVRRAEGLYRHYRIQTSDTSGISVEEIATTVLQRSGIRRELLG